MFEWHYVGGYWGPRKETALECARRAELFFHMLKRCDPTFTHWYRGGRGAPRSLPGHFVRPETSEWEQLFLKGQARSDFDKKIVIEEFGFSEYVWNAKGTERTRIEFSCGAYSPGATNLCLLYPPQEGPLREHFLRVPLLTQVLTCMATAWDPDFALVGSSEMIELVRMEKGERKMGWLTYLSRRLGRVPLLPAPVRIEPVGTIGWLIILSSECMTASNPEHVEFTARIRELLDRAGLIRRPDPVTGAE